jgi:hypothetical protein
LIYFRFVRVCGELGAQAGQARRPSTGFSLPAKARRARVSSPLPIGKPWPVPRCEFHIILKSD